MFENNWLRIINPLVTGRLGHIQQVLFDFDGTLSVLRQGWEPVMAEVMLEAICGSEHRTPEIEQEVHEYIDLSTGILTIQQMQWLEGTVRQHGLVAAVLTATEYKQIYLRKLMQTVNQRIVQVEHDQVTPEQWMVAGSMVFLSQLTRRGIKLYAASGTDHLDVLHEAQVLGLAPFFEGGIYGALDEIEAHAKERIIQRILYENHLSGDELMVVGDGPVEIREAKQRRALTLGVASDEVNRRGWNRRKVRRLTNAQADLLVPDFLEAERLVDFLFSMPDALSGSR
jgi:phosphoglycolate phosphatase-like HAD superfamily hydrolase